MRGSAYAHGEGSYGLVNSGGAQGDPSSVIARALAARHNGAEP